MNKDIRITFRVTPKDYVRIKGKADQAHMSVSAYVRAAALRHKVVVVDSLKEYTHELKGIGRSLNQLTILTHELAMEFAARAWPHSEVLITTHIDKPHIHSHFLVNAVCHQTGRMLRQEKGSLKRLRTLSDELCEAHGFSVLKDTQKKSDGMKARDIKMRLCRATRNPCENSSHGIERTGENTKNVGVEETRLQCPHFVVAEAHQYIREEN